ncbi:MAG: ABC transporter ATP-binding protein [Actinomycetota bacterium]|nr:ABC transporter ATP-binding protein [Actinomycetota bacterium]
MPVVEISDLVVTYQELRAVDGLNFSAESGQITAILGPNGAGKSSTIEVACNLRRPDSGQVRLFGLPPSSAEVRPRMGVMLQSGGLYPTARPLEWLQYLAKLYPQTGDPSTLLADVGIDPSTRTQTRRLSGGEQQRVKLAAALLGRPELLFLDEPTAGLDALARRNLLELLKQRRSAGAAIVLTTHMLPDVEDLADAITVMSQGKVAMQGTLAELTGTQSALSFGGPLGLDCHGLAQMLPANYEVRETQPGRYVVSGTPTPDIMARITAWSAKQGVMVTELGIGDRTLEQLLIDTSTAETR